MTGPVRACPVCPECGGKKFARIARGDAPRHPARGDGRRPDGPGMMALRCRNCGSVSGF